MRWCLLLVGLMVVGPAVAQPDSVAHRFDRANAAYAQERYAQATDIYHQILADGFESGALHYNLGNAYVRLGQLGQAIRYYEKARRLQGPTPRLTHNLEQARRSAGVYPAPSFRGGAAFVRTWSPLLLFWGGWVLLGGGLAGAVVGRARSGVLRRTAKWSGLVGGGLLVLVALGTSYLQTRDHRAVVVADEAPLHATPASDAAPDTTLPEGTLLKVRRHRTEWREVRLGNRRAGWVPTRVLGDI